jgi:hypothetical protein
VVDRIAHDEAAVRRLVDRFDDRSRLRTCYEAGPTGFGLYRLLRSMGVACDVVAPSLRRCCIKRSSRSLGAKSYVGSNSAAQLGLKDRGKSDPMVGSEPRPMAVLPPVFSILAENLRRQDHAMA